jgi:hypothetical protein
LQHEEEQLDSKQSDTPTYSSEDGANESAKTSDIPSTTPSLSKQSSESYRRQEPPAAAPTPLTIQQKAEMESLALTLLYISWFAPPACDNSAVQSTFGHVVTRLMDPANPLKPKETYFPDFTWNQAFRQKNVRFISRAEDFKNKWVTHLRKLSEFGINVLT